jgi:hypothetical protein
MRIILKVFFIAGFFLCEAFCIAVNNISNPGFESIREIMTTHGLE